MLSALQSMFKPGELAKGKLTPESGTAFEFPFNPSSLKYNRKVQWDKKDILSDAWPGLVYSKGVAAELSFSLLLDETESDNPLAAAMAGIVPNPFALPVGAAMSGPAGTLAALATVKASSAARSRIPKNTKSVTGRIAALQQFTLPLVDDPRPNEANAKRPPFVTFTWGDFQFVGVVKSLDAEVLLFDGNGNPKRATVQVGMEGAGLAALDTAKMIDVVKRQKAAEEDAKKKKP